MLKSKIIGKQIKQWFVKELIREEPYGTPDGRIHRFYKCICRCGNEYTLDEVSLSQKHGKASCGCVKPNHILKSREQVLERYIYNQYTQNARNRGFILGLKREELYNIVTQNCYYCNAPPSNLFRDRVGKDRDAFYNGIDRVDNTLNYISSNCVPCCRDCNYAKNVMDQQAFLNLVDRIYNHSVKSKQESANA